MGINSVGGPNVGGINADISTSEIKQAPTFAGMKIATGNSDKGKSDMGVQSSVEQKVSLDKTQEVNQTEATQETKKSAGIFGKFQIGQGAGSSAFKNKLNVQSNVENKGLDSRMKGQSPDVPET
ncbi:MAG: hypothetical protein LBS71_02500 [Puniceicoccales bacterium]|jgi:hypothetical protein|nr:hypothetical protein [Puniceicoccales bacterium]